jgi:streptogramin lyase
MRRRILSVVVPIAAILATLVMNVAPASSDPAPVFTAFAHTRVQTARGLAAEGKYVWISDLSNDGHAAHIFRVDATTGAEKVITNALVTLPSQVVASRRYAWVMNEKLNSGDSRWSLLRVNAATLAVRRIEIPSAAVTGVAYLGGPIVLANGYVWIPGSRGISRVNTTTLKVSTISSPLIGALIGVAVDSHYLWLNATSVGNDSSVTQTYFVRVSLTTGMVTKVNFPGVKGGDPIGDDGTNLWVANSKGIQRINPTDGHVTTVEVPKGAQVTSTTTGPSAIANGGIYFDAGLPALNRTGVVGVGIASGRATVLSSPLLYDPSFMASANGVVWIVNATTQSSLKDQSRWPTLVRVSWPSQS